MTNESPRGWASPIPYGTSEETSIVSDRARDDDFSPWELAACVPISDWPASASMSCTDLDGDRAPDDVVPNHLGLIVVSSRCRDVMLAVEGTGDCVEFLLVRLDHLGQDVGAFYVLNVLASIPAMDKERSRFDVYTSLDEAPQPVGGIKTIRRLVLLPGLLQSKVPVFRLQENLGWVLFGPSLRAALESADVTGFEWTEVALSSDFED